MTLFLLDADIALYAIRRHPSVSASLAATDPATIRLSALVHSQLSQGIYGQPAPDAELKLIDAFVVIFGVIPYDLAASNVYRGIIAAIGFSRRDVTDRMIAAHAISLDATLVTNNSKVFTGIPGLRLANWADA